MSRRKSRLLTRAGRASLAGVLLLLVMAACAPASPGTVLEPALATGTAIVAEKATSAAQMAATLTAQPTETATPTPQAGAALCQPADLSPQAASEGATGSIAISLTLTNQTSYACSLQGPPDVKLIDAADRALDFQTSYSCFQCEPGVDFPSLTPATQAAIIPTATAIAYQALSELITLQPGQSAGVFMLWQNWCEPFPEGGVTVLLNLPGTGNRVAIASGAKTGGRCDAPSAPSTLVISQYQLR